MIIVVAAIILFIVCCLRPAHNATAVPRVDCGGKSTASRGEYSGNSYFPSGLQLSKKRMDNAALSSGLAFERPGVSSELDRSVLFDGQNRCAPRNRAMRS
jgi:hypothetical protein